MNGSETCVHVSIFRHSRSGVEFQAVVSIGGSDGVLTSAHLEFELATVSARYLWGSDIASARMSSYTLRLAVRLVDVQFGSRRLARRGSRCERGVQQDQELAQLRHRIGPVSGVLGVTDADALRLTKREVDNLSASHACCGESLVHDAEFWTAASRTCYGGG